MLGAIIGDIAGSRFEWKNHKSKEFTLLTVDCSPTDDSMMTIAVAQALLRCGGDYRDLSVAAIHSMQEIGRRHPYAGYGVKFRRWLAAKDPQPYNSWGNGSAMRISPVAWVAGSLSEAITLSEVVSAVSHNHPEGIRGAEAVTVAIYLALHGSSREELRRIITENYYPLDFTLDAIRPAYTFDVSCQGSVPQALQAFFEATDFEDAIRNAISIGGDSDTIAAITGSIAEAFFGIPDDLRNKALRYLPEEELKIVHGFESRFGISKHI